MAAGGGRGCLNLISRPYSRARIGQICVPDTCVMRVVVVVAKRVRKGASGVQKGRFKGCVRSRRGVGCHGGFVDGGVEETGVISFVEIDVKRPRANKN